MKNCKNCGVEIEEKYTYCAGCVKKWKEAEQTKNPMTTPKAWHTDPVVDALLKLNSNCGNIVKELATINETLKDVHLTLLELRNERGELIKKNK